MAQSSLSLQFVVDRKTVVDDVYFNRLLAALENRFAAIETPQRNLDQILDQILTIGLQRVNESIQPVYAEIAGLAEVGSLLSAVSTTLITPTLGHLVFGLDNIQAARFAPMPFLAAVSTLDPATYIIGTLVNFDRAEGAVVINAEVIEGSAAQSNWVIQPALPLTVPNLIDPGTF